MKLIHWLLEPIREMFQLLAATDEIAINLRALGWTAEDLEAIRVFAQIGGTADHLRRIASYLGRPHD